MNSMIQWSTTSTERIDLLQHFKYPHTRPHSCLTTAPHFKKALGTSSISRRPLSEVNPGSGDIVASGPAHKMMDLQQQGTTPMPPESEGNGVDTFLLAGEGMELQSTVVIKLEEHYQQCTTDSCAPHDPLRSGETSQRTCVH